MAKPVTLIARPHLLRPDTYVCEVEPGASLAELIGEADETTQADVGGVPVPRDWWRQVRPKAGAQVLVYRVPQGGGSARKVTRKVINIVLAAAAAVTGNYWYAAAAFAGIAATNYLLADPIPRLNNVESKQLTFNRREAITGTRNQANPFGAIPRVYGRHRFFPPYAALPYSDIVGDEQFFNVLLCLGYGPLAVEDIRIGDTPISNFEDTQFEIGASPDLISTDVYEEALGAELNAPPTGGEANQPVIRTTRPETDEIAVVIVYPQGLYGIAVNGNELSHKSHWFIEHGPAGSGIWINALDADSIVYSDGDIAAVGAGDVRIRVTGTEAMTRRIMIRWTVAAGQYDVRIRRLADEATAGAVQTYSDATVVGLQSRANREPFALDNAVLLALRLRSTGQLSGSLDTVNCIATSILPVYDGATWLEQATSNPAWIYTDVAAGVATERALDPDTPLDLNALQVWAEECAAQGRTFSAVVDARTNVYDLMRDIATAGRAAQAVTNGQHGVIQDLPDQPVMQHIAPRNSADFGGQLSLEPPPHAFKVQYVNATRDWQLDEQIVYDDGYSAANATRFEALELRGVTDATAAWREARYRLAARRLRRELFTVRLDVENLAAVRGDLVHLAHDVILQGIGWGRILSLTTGGGVIQTITLDTAVEMDVGKTYAVRARPKTGGTERRSITTVAGEQTTLTFTAGPADGTLNPGDLVLVGETGLESLACKIVAIEPGSDLSARVVLTPEAAPAIYTADVGAAEPADYVVVADAGGVGNI